LHGRRDEYEGADQPHRRTGVGGHLDDDASHRSRSLGGSRDPLRSGPDRFHGPLLPDRRT
jgi:hypothetical protein